MTHHCILEKKKKKKDVMVVSYTLIFICESKRQGGEPRRFVGKQSTEVVGYAFNTELVCDKL